MLELTKGNQCSLNISSCEEWSFGAQLGAGRWPPAPPPSFLEELRSRSHSSKATAVSQLGLPHRDNGHYLDVGNGYPGPLGQSPRSLLSAQRGRPAENLQGASLSTLRWAGPSPPRGPGWSRLSPGPGLLICSSCLVGCENRMNVYIHCAHCKAPRRGRRAVIVLPLSPAAGGPGHWLHSPGVFRSRRLWRLELRPACHRAAETRVSDLPPVPGEGLGLLAAKAHSRTFLLCLTL